MTPAPWISPVTGPHSTRTASSAAMTACRSVTSARRYRTAEPAVCTAAIVSRISLAAMSAVACSRIRRGSAAPLARRRSVTAWYIACLPRTPWRYDGSSSNSDLPSRTIRSGCTAASARTAAAVTPRAPPLTTTTAPGTRTPASRSPAGAGTARRMVRTPPAPRPTSVLDPPVSSSRAIASATVAVSRPLVGQSMALTATAGHSLARVLADAARPAKPALAGAEAPKSPPVSCTMTNAPPRSGSNARAIRNTSRVTAGADIGSGPSPPR